MFEKSLFTDEEFDELESALLNDLATYYHNYHFSLNSEVIKNIALSSVFLNMFYLCENNPQIFYGKSVINLTFHQIDLFSYGKYFKSILSNYQGKIPPNVMSDPDKLIDWIECTNNAKDIMDDDKGGALSLMGACREDYEYLGIDKNQIVDFSKELQKSGKSKLDMDDRIKIGRG